MGPTADSTSSTERAGRASLEAAVVLGRVVGAHGLRGQLRVSTAGDVVESVMRVPQVWLSPRQEDPTGREYPVIQLAAGRPGELRMTLDGVGDRDAAEALRGLWVLARGADLEALPPGEYYAHQLLGCRVEDSAGRAIGVVRRIWETGAPDVLVVEDAAGVEQLIPAAESILQEVDLEGRRIVIDAIPGLLERD
jgi:16S rRNA processing protein RimM